MLPGKKYKLSDIVRVCLHRWWLIVLPFAIGTFIGILTHKRLPELYRSDALLLAMFPSSDAPPLAATLDTRLSSVTDRVLSRSSLERIIADLKLYEYERARITKEDVIKRMRNDIETRVEGVNTFRLSYVSADPNAAQKGAERIASLYVQQGQPQKESRTEAANVILDTQIQDTKQQLLETEQKLEEYRRRRAGPHRSADRIQTAQKQLQSVSESLKRARERRRVIERQVTYANDMPEPVVPPGTTGIARTGAESQPQTAPHDSIGELQERLKTIDREIAERQREEAKWNKAIADYQVQLALTRESELLELTRGYSTLWQRYSTLLEKREASKQVASGVTAEQFQMLDPPFLPENPYNRRQRLGALWGGALGGLALGLALVAFVELRESTFKSEEDVLSALSIPVLAVIPAMGSDERPPSASRTVGSSVVSSILFCLGGAAVMVLRHLQA